jgi:uncharacterized membrane protein
MTVRGLTSRQTALLVAISLAGIALRFVAIDRSYWFDELATLNTIDVPNWTTVVQITARDNQPPLYNSAAFAWIQLFGVSEIALRSLSIVFGLLALFTPWLARTSLSRTEKLLCFTILCLMPLPIRHAQEARNYSLLFLLSSTCLFCYYEMIKAKSRRLQIQFHASLILLAFSHLFGLLLAVSFLAVMFWRERRIAPRLGLILYGIALSALILVPLVRGGSGEHVAGNFWITFSAATFSKQLLMVFTPVGMALIVYALVLWRRSSERAPLDPALLAALMPFILMLAGSIAISFNTPILTDRNLIGLIPAYALLTAWLLQHVITRNAAPLTLALLCLLMLQTVALTYSPILFMQEDFRSIAKYSIATNSRVCYVLPATMETPPPHIFSFYVSRLYGRPDLDPEQMSLAAVPQDIASSDCRLWAEATLQKRGITVLGTLPQFSQCADVPLSQPRARAASELWDCRH